MVQTIEQAVRESLENILTGKQSAIVAEGDGTYTCIPMAYLTDGSYNGSRLVIWTVENLDSVFPTQESIPTNDTEWDNAVSYYSEQALAE